MGRRLASLGNGSESVERPCAKILSYAGVARIAMLFWLRRCG